MNVGKDTVSSGNNSISAGATLISQMDEKTSGSLAYSQGVQINSNTDDVFENWRITGSLSRSVLEDMKSSFSTFYGKGDYSSTSVSDTLMGASVSLSYNFWQGKRGSSMNGNLGYSYSNLESTNEARGYTRNSINTSLKLAF